MEEFIGRMLGILIVGIVILVAQHFEYKREFKKWEETFRKPLWDGRFHYKGHAASVGDLYKTYKNTDDYYCEVGDVWSIDTPGGEQTVVWDGKNFVEIRNIVPFREQGLRKCMCCGKIVDHSLTYTAPAPNSAHGREWMGIKTLIICSECGNEWAKRCDVNGAGSDEEIHARITAGNKWLFDQVVAHA